MCIDKPVIEMMQTEDDNMNLEELGIRCTLLGLISDLASSCLHLNKCKRVDANADIISSKIFCMYVNFNSCVNSRNFWVKVQLKLLVAEILLSDTSSLG